MMLLMRAAIIVFLTAGFALPARADEGVLSAEDFKTLTNLQAQMKAQQLSGASAEEDKAALAATGNLFQNDPKTVQQFQNLSNNVMNEISAKTEENPEAMARALLEAQADPKKFLRNLSPANQAELKRLATEIDNRAQKR